MKLQELTLPELIAHLERLSVFESQAAEAELNRRLERTGQRWRFNRDGRIELSYPDKQRPAQRPLDYGLFDSGARQQVDLTDWLFRKR